jgi:hypothetical protein
VGVDAGRRRLLYFEEVVSSALGCRKLPFPTTIRLGVNSEDYIVIISLLVGLLPGPWY